MKIWAIGDLHLSFGVPSKEMDVFGENWKAHYDKIRLNWDKLVKPEDIVLIPGDISWAKHLNEVMPDLEWIAKRPGTKVMIRGNHDYWWHTSSKIRKMLPPSILIIHNDALVIQGVAIGGTRLWDSPEYTFDDCIEMKAPLVEVRAPPPEDSEESKKVFTRELQRLQMSLDAMPKDARLKIIMTHYPPIGTDLQDSTVSKMMEKAHINHVVFGHLHSVKHDKPLFGEKNGVNYHLTACDYLNFVPLEVAEIP